jgi:hypothetical protein
MPKYFKNIQSLLIVVLIVVIFLMRSCSGKDTPTEPQIIRDTIIEYVTIEKTYPVYVPKVKYVTKVDIDTFSTPIDTATILADYYAIKTYEDKQVLDSLNLVITDTISQNQIKSRKISYTFTYPQTTIRETIILNKRELYFGIGATGNQDQLQYLGGEVIFRNKKRQAYGLGVGVDQNLVPVISARMYWKLGK